MTSSAEEKKVLLWFKHWTLRHGGSQERTEYKEVDSSSHREGVKSSTRKRGRKIGKNLDAGASRNRLTSRHRLYDGRFFNSFRKVRERKEEGRDRTEGVADFPSRYLVAEPSELQSHQLGHAPS